MPNVVSKFHKLLIDLQKQFYFFYKRPVPDTTNERLDTADS